MNGQIYLDILKKRLEYYYDSKPLPEKPQFIYAAELNAADEGYFIIPNLKTYSVQHNEYLYIQIISEPMTLKTIQPYLDFTKEKMAALKTTTEHMSSIFSLIFICESGIASEDINKLIQIKQHKDYCFTLKGWSDLALYFMDIPSNKLYCNKEAQKNKELFTISE